MIQSVTITSHLAASTFALTALESSGAVLLDITGVAEQSNEVSIEKTSTLPTLTNIAVLARPIGFVFRLTGSNVEAKRYELRQLFPVGLPITMDFSTTEKDLSIVGIVESFENPIFTDQSLLTVNVLCADPYFIGQEVSSVFTDTETIINDGELPVGCYFGLKNLDLITSDFSIVNSVGQEMKFSLPQISAIIGGNMNSTDTLVIDTRSPKSVSLLRDGTEINLFGSLQIPFKWIQLQQGSNIISIGPAFGLTVDYVFTKKYAGL